jgi:hypothetical protein
MSIESRVKNLETRTAVNNDDACICRNPTVVRRDSGGEAEPHTGLNTPADNVCATCGGAKLIINVVRVSRPI